MEFWDKITKKASETYKGASEKTNKIARETKLKLKMNENKSKIKDLYEEIGKKIYQKHVANEKINIKQDMKEEIEKIDKLAAEVEEFEKEIWDLQDHKQCPKCKEKIKKDATFCPNCGEKQPEPEVMDVEVVLDEDTEDKASEAKTEVTEDSAESNKAE